MADAMAALMASAKVNTAIELRATTTSASGRLVPASLPSSAHRPGTAVAVNHSPVKALSGSGLGGATIALLQDLRPSARGRAFIDPIAVGAFLAAEGKVARVQTAHRQILARGRGDDSDDEENNGDDAAANGSGGSSSNSHSRVQARASAAATMAATAMGLPVPGSSGAPPELRLKRRMQGVLTDDFFGLLRATEREVSAEAEESKQQAAANAEAGGTAAPATASAPVASSAAAASSPSLLFDAGPLTRALHAKQAAATAEAARRAATKREAHLRKLRGKDRPSTANNAASEHDQEEEDETSTKFSRLRADMIEEDAVEDADAFDESQHHRLCMPHICVPPSITYRKGVATAWYFSSTMDGSVKRKHTRNLIPKKISACMDAVQYRTAWQAQRPLDVVAVFYHSEAHMSPLYLDREGVARFVGTDADRLRCTGVLQKFVPPQAESNTMLRVSWTPRMCLVEKRTSSYKLDARRLGMEERVQTFEVATGLGVEVREEAVHDSSSLRRTLQDTCEQIAEHLTIVHGYTMAAQQARVIAAPAGASTSSSSNAMGGSGGGGSSSSGGGSAGGPALASRPVKMTLYLKLAGQHQLFLLLCDELKWSRADPEVIERSLGAGSSDGDPARAQALFQHMQLLQAQATAQTQQQLAKFRYPSRVGQDEKEALLNAELETPQSTALLNACAARRRAIDAATRARSRAAARLAHAALHGNATAGPLDRRQKRGDVKCGHCRVTLTAGNSALSATSGAIMLPSGPVTAAEAASTHSSSSSLTGGGRPYLDLHSVLLYRLTLCLHLLPAAPPPGSNFPPAHWSNLQTIRSAFFWNLARAILVPAYMDDEKELKVHLILDEARRMAKHKEEQKRQAILAGRNPDDESGGPVLLASPSAAAVGIAGVAASKSTAASAASIWDTRIYVCRNCSASIRTARRAWTVPGGGPIQRVFDTLLDAYIEHERLRDAPPEPVPTIEDPVPAAHHMSPRFIAAHARSLARLQLGPKDGTKKEINTPLASIYVGPPLRSPNPGIPLPPALVAPPTLDAEGELSWPVHLSSSSAPIRVELRGDGGDGTDGGAAASFGFVGTGEAAQALPDPVEAWMDPHAPPGEAVRALLQEDALNPSAKTTSLLEELTAGLECDGPGVHMTRSEREEARRAREEARRDRQARQQAAELEAAAAEIRAARGGGEAYKARHFAHVSSKVLETPEEVARRREEEALRSDDDGSIGGLGFDPAEEEDDAMLSADEQQQPETEEDADSAAGKLSRMHERILARLARVDPVRATLLREKVAPGGGILSDKTWNPDTKLRARVEAAVARGAPEQREADEAEWARVKQQLREWQRKHQAKLAAARARIAELALADAERARPRPQTATLAAAERRLRASQSASALLVSAGLEAPPSPPQPPFESRVVVPKGSLFGDPAPIDPNHGQTNNFRVYRKSERVYVSSYDTLTEKGGLGYGSSSRSPSHRRIGTGTSAGDSLSSTQVLSSQTPVARSRPSTAGFDHAAAFVSGKSAYESPTRHPRTASMGSGSVSLAKLKLGSTTTPQRPSTAHSRLGGSVGSELSSPDSTTPSHRMMSSPGLLSPAAGFSPPVVSKHAQRIAASPLAYKSNTAAARSKQQRPSHSASRQRPTTSSSGGGVGGGTAHRRPGSALVSSTGGQALAQQEEEDAIESRLAAAEGDDIDDAPIFSSDEEESGRGAAAATGNQTKKPRADISNLRASRANSAKAKGKRTSSWSSSKAQEAEAQRLIEQAEKKLFQQG